MLRLIMLALEIQVVADGDIRPLIFWSQDKQHIKLSPAFLLNTKWRQLEGCAENASQIQGFDELTTDRESLELARMYIL